MRTVQVLIAAATVFTLAACGGNNKGNTFREAVITSVSPTVVTPGAEITVTGSNYYAVTGAGATRIEACGTTVNGSLVEPLTSTILLPPASTITAEVSNTITGTLPAAGFAAGSSDVRVTRPDGSTAVLENAVACELPSSEPTPVVAVLTGSATTGVAPATITFSAADSTGEGELEYGWDFGVDGSTATGVETEFEYLQAGTYTVTLTVTDETGAIDTATQVITVHPVLAAKLTYSGPTGSAPVTIRFDATSSTGIAPLSYVWDFGDESGTSSEAQPGYEYPEGGSYTVSLTVTDATGRTDTVTADVHIPAAVMAVITADRIVGTAPLNVNFSALHSNGEGDLEFQWDFGKADSTSTDPEPVFTFNTGGTYTVTLTVTDETGAIDTATQVIAVDAEPASVTFTVPNFDTYNELSVDIFNADDNTAYYTWNKGDPPVQITEPGDYYAMGHTPDAYFDETEHSYNTFSSTPRYNFTVSPTDSGVRTIDLSSPQQVMAQVTVTSNLQDFYNDTVIWLAERFKSATSTWVEVSVSPEFSSFHIEPGVYRFRANPLVTVDRGYWIEELAPTDPHIVVGLSSGTITSLYFEYETQPSLGVSVSSNYPDAQHTFTLTDATNTHHYDHTDTLVPPGGYTITYNPIDVMNTDGRNGVSPTYERLQPSVLVQTIYLSSNQQLTRTQDYGAPSQPAIRLTITGPEGPMPPFQGDVRINRQGSMMVVDADDIQNGTIHPLDVGHYCVEANDTTNFVVTNNSHAEPNNCFDLDTSYDYQGGDHAVDVTINYEARDVTVFIHFPDHPTNEVPAGTPVRLKIDVTTTEDLSYVTFYVWINDNSRWYYSHTQFSGNTRNFTVDRIFTGQAFQAGDQVKIIVEVKTISDTEVTFEGPPLQIVP